MEGQARQHQGSRSEGGRPSASGRDLWGGLVGVPEGGKGGDGNRIGPRRNGNRFGMRIGKGWKRSRAMGDGVIEGVRHGMAWDGS